MKIAIVTRDYNCRGGIERVSQFHARGLRDLGHEVTIIANEAQVSESDAGLQIEALGLRRRHAYRLVADFAHASATVVQHRNFDSVLVMGASCTASDTIVMAHSVHKRWFTYSKSLLSPSQLRWWMKVANPLHYAVMGIEKRQYAAGQYRHLIAVSEPIKRELTEEYGVPAEAVSVVPNGMPYEDLEPNIEIRDKMRREMGVAPADPLLLFVGNEFERKGLRALLRSLPKVGRTVKLAIVGGGNGEPFMPLIRQLGLEESVMFIGRTDRIQDYFWASDLFVLPTHYEAWNVAIGEALAAGLPVVTTKLGQADAMIVEGKNGYLLKNPSDEVEIAGAISDWLERADRQEMRIFARKSAEPFAWGEMTKRLESVLMRFPARSQAHG